MKKVLLHFTNKYAGEWEKIYNALDNKEKIKDEILDNMKKYKKGVLAIIDDSYPNRFKRIQKPPFIIFHKGDAKLMKSKHILGVCGVGTDKELPKNIDEIFKDLKTIPIVTQLATEVDVAIVNIALKNKRKVIYLRPNGFDTPLSETNQKLHDEILASKGLVITEFPNNVKTNLEVTKAATRVFTGISDAVLITSSLTKQALDTTKSKKIDMAKVASEGLGQAKEVIGFFAQFPDEKYAGNNEMIKNEEISPVINAYDIKKALEAL